MTVSGNLPHVQVEEEPKNRTPNNNMNKHQRTIKKHEGNEADSAATKKTTTEIPTPSNAVKEDDADSTATTITTTATSTSGSEWEEYITEGVGKMQLEEITYVFGKRRWVKPARKWKSINNHGNKEKQTMSFTSTCATTQSMEGVFMFGNAARSTTVINPMPALQELANYQKPKVQQKRNRQKASNWAKSGKFKVTNQKSGEPNSQNQTVRKHNKTRSKPKKENSI